MHNLLKKLSAFTIAVLLMTGTAFAQSQSSDISVTGNDNDATVDQTGGLHEAQIKQVGDENETTITQDGYSHKGVQTMARGDQNITNITQNGGDFATTSGGNSLARVELWGDRNLVDITQLGDAQRAFVDIQQGANFDNDVDVRQEGSENAVNIDINGDANVVNTVQDGAQNGIGAVFGTVGVDVDGNNNESIVQQVGDHNTTLFTQDGDGNKAVERMTRGDGNAVDIYQMGDDNRAVYEIWGDDNTIDIDQMSSGNDVFINGRGTPTAPGGGVSDNTVTIHQGGGDFNTVSGFFEDGSESNMVSIMQSGTGNEVLSASGPGLFIDGDHNTATIMQSGVGNSAEVEMIGNGNTSTVNQD